MIIKASDLAGRAGGCKFFRASVDGLATYTYWCKWAPIFDLADCEACGMFRKGDGEIKLITGPCTCPICGNQHTVTNIITTSEFLEMLKGRETRMHQTSLA